MAVRLEPGMRVTSTLSARQAQTTGDSKPTDPKVWVAVGVVIAATLIGACLAGYIAYRFQKRAAARQHQRLNSTDSESQATTEAQPNGPSRSGTLSNRNSTFNTNRLSVRSIRSIITLPPYKETPRETEEVVARAGDREGLDYIVEGPETAEDIENARLEEMSTLYRVQQTRRREVEERTERRRARGAALERQDYREVARLDRAAAEARQRQRNGSSASLASNGVRLPDFEPSSADLIAELQVLRTRPRRVSEVAYGELGRARHDGSRIRGGSIEDDSAPLLELSAAMGGRPSTESRSRSRASSVASRQNGQSRPITRERSRSRASRDSAGGRNGVGGADGLQEPSRRTSDDELPPDPPSYDDDLSVHAGEAPRYEDVIIDTPTHSSSSDGDNNSGRPATSHSTPQTPVVDDNASFHTTHETLPSSENAETAESPRHGSGFAATAVPLRLQNRSSRTPAIEVHIATPNHSVPTTPTATQFSATAETSRPIEP